MYIVHCTLYNVHCILYTVHCILYIVHCILYSVHWPLYIVHYTVHTVYCTLYTVQFIVYNVQCTLYTVKCTLYINSWTSSYHLCNHRRAYLYINKYTLLSSPAVSLHGTIFSTTHVTSLLYIVRRTSYACRTSYVYCRCNVRVRIVYTIRTVYAMCRYSLRRTKMLYGAQFTPCDVHRRTSTYIEWVPKYNCNRF